MKSISHTLLHYFYGLAGVCDITYLYSLNYGFWDSNFPYILYSLMHPFGIKN